MLTTQVIIKFYGTHELHHGIEKEKSHTIRYSCLFNLDHNF